MNIIIESAIIGLVQGITEFLPVSSSAHLVFIQDIFGWEEPELFFDIVLHCATLLAILVYFRKDILNLFHNLKTVLLIIIGTIPTCIIGLLLKKYITDFFAVSLYPAIFLLITGTLLYFCERYHKEKKTMDNFSISDVIIVGIVQGISVLPGISRSGSTIATGMFLGWNRTDTVKFVFLLSIPSILGATLVELKQATVSNVNISGYIVGCITAFVSAIFAINILMKIVRNMKLHVFAYYCWFIGIFVLIISLWY